MLSCTFRLLILFLLLKLYSTWFVSIIIISNLLLSFLWLHGLPN